MNHNLPFFDFQNLGLPAKPLLPRRGRLGLLLCVALSGCGGGDSENPVSLPPRAAAVALPSGGAVGAVQWPEGNSAAGGQGEPVAGLDCGLMSTEYHVHAHLSIFVNGAMRQIPPHAGIVPATATRAECTYPLHTHDGTGKIHVEAPASGRFTLGQFFAIWGQPLSSSNVAGVTGLPVVVYVADGGTVRRHEGDPGEIELSSHREITIQLGSAISAIPNYTWDGL
jgi:hypothetical protein